MHNKTFSRLLEQLKRLAPSQKETLQSTLHTTSEAERVSSVIDAVNSYPYCTVLFFFY